MVEILKDHKADAARNDLLLGEEHEILGSFHWLEWLKRRTGNDRLFVYRHRVLGSFVLAVWAWDPSETTSPVAVELETFHADPATLWPKDLMHPWALLSRLRPVEEVVKEREAKRAAQKEYEAKGKREDLAHRSSVVGYLKRKGMGEAAHNLNTGATPFCGPARATPGSLERWKDLAKAAVRSS
jgi:hypothetical protein